MSWEHLKQMFSSCLWRRVKRTILRRRLQAVPGGIPKKALLRAPLLEIVLTIDFKGVIALAGLEPAVSALRGRRVNQLHHSAENGAIIKAWRREWQARGGLNSGACVMRVTACARGVGAE